MPKQNESIINNLRSITQVAYLKQVQNGCQPANVFTFYETKFSKDNLSVK